ncbi:MAG: hypothetical protein Kow0037_19930 [Calditrichia bacterium]
MKKPELIKLILFFSLSFVVILTIMTVVLGMLQKPAPPAEEVAVADSTAVVDSVPQANPLDSLQQVLAKMEEENKKLKEMAEKEPEPEEEEQPEATKNTKEIAKIYENMPPQEAANLLTGLGTDAAAEILAKMKKRQAAKVLAAMEPQTAVEVSKKIASIH